MMPPGSSPKSSRARTRGLGCVVAAVAIVGPGGPAFADEPAAPAPSQVWVTLEADSPEASLEVREVGEWKTVCGGPCRIAVDRDAAYRIGGAQVTPSAVFHLPPTGDAFRLGVHAGSLGSAQAAPRLMFSGIAVALVGGILLGEEASHPRPDAGVEAAAGALLGVGVAALTLAGILWHYGPSRVVVAPGTPASSGPTVSLRPLAVVF